METRTAPAAFTADVNESMRNHIRDGGNSTSIEAAAALAAGLLAVSNSPTCRYVTSATGNEWLIANAVANGSDRAEAIRALDYLDGVGA